MLHTIFYHPTKNHLYFDRASVSPWYSFCNISENPFFLIKKFKPAFFLLNVYIFVTSSCCFHWGPIPLTIIYLPLIYKRQFLLYLLVFISLPILWILLLSFLSHYQHQYYPNIGVPVPVFWGEMK